jgi:DUF1680 family protein
MTDDPRLAEHLRGFVRELIATQREDGYLGPFPSGEGMMGKGRWDLWGQYHVMLGLLKWHRQTGDAAALAAARRCADHFCRVFLEGGKRVVQAGSEEMNESSIHVFTLLYRQTGEDRYLRLAREIEEDWEAPPSGDYVRSALAGKAFYQCPKPRWESLHSVQAIAELYLITGDPKYRKAFERIWWSIAEFDRHNTGRAARAPGARSARTCCGSRGTAGRRTSWRSPRGTRSWARSTRAGGGGRTTRRWTATARRRHTRSSSRRGRAARN